MVVHLVETMADCLAMMKAGRLAAYLVDKWEERTAAYLVDSMVDSWDEMRAAYLAARMAGQ